MAAWNAAHREERKAYNAAPRALHLEELKRKEAAYRAAHREEKKAAAAAWRAADPNRAKASRKVSAAAHPVTTRACNAAHVAERRRYRRRAEALRRRAGTCEHPSSLASLPGACSPRDAGWPVNRSSRSLWSRPW